MGNSRVLGEKKVLEVLNEATEIQDDEWGKEYLDYIIGVKIVKDVDEER